MPPSPLRFAGLITEIVGTLVVSLSIFVLHATLRAEKSFEERLIHQFKRERIMVVVGILLIVAGFIMIIVEEAEN